MKKIIKIALFALSPFCCLAQSDAKIEVSTPKGDFILIDRKGIDNKSSNTEKILFVINGKVKDETYELNSIKAEDIERIEVLKGKNMETYLAEHKITRSVEGVILITTKKV